MTILITAAAALLGELALTAVLGGLAGVARRAGAGDRSARLHEALCRAPLLDVVVATMTLLPPVLGAAIAGWAGLFGALIGQALALPAWIRLHEWRHRKAAHGPRMVAVQDRVAGRARNRAALWCSTLALPVFWGLRLGEILLYPPIRRLLRFPTYRHGDWVNVSRHKHQGLVGHDLAWCLYCDWMTGVFSLAGEMLRTVESFWCPVRFHNAAKCENCSIDFPDVARWAPADGDLTPAVVLLEQAYGGGERTWLGHPARLTVEGGSIGDAGAPASPGDPPEARGPAGRAEPPPP